jgi:CRP/FNR family transcriptional regulator
MISAQEVFSESVKSICPELMEGEIDAFISLTTVREYKRKELFLEAGKVQKEIGFITAGLVRSSYIDNDGNEITIGFYAQNDYATHYPTFIIQQPSNYTIQCLEATTMVCLSFKNIQLVYQQMPAFERYGRLVAEEILKRQQARIESFIFQTAEERYLAFMDHQSDLYNRVSLSHLCSFLGIERQTLTRIRQKLAHQ